MSNMIIYTCPKCGGDLQELCLASMPPQYKMVCLSCGWSEIKKSEPLEIVRVPYQSEVNAVMKTKSEDFNTEEFLGEIISL